MAMKHKNSRPCGRIIMEQLSEKDRQAVKELIRFRRQLSEAYRKRR